MNLIIVGLNHKTAPIETREKLSFPADRIGASLKRLLQSYDVNEGVIISTCNRVEVLAVAADIEKGVWELKRFLAECHDIPLEELDEYLYVHTAEDAVQHVFRVASSLDSMVMGEPQILGQVKDAYGQAVHNDTAGVIMNKLFHKTFSVAKRIRTETNIGSSAVSISFAAVELAKKIFGELTGKTAMLLGAGEMAELSARHLISGGVREIIIVNRTYERAVEMAREFKGTPVMFREFPHYLKNVDIVIASTASPKFIIRPDDVIEVMKERKHRPMFFIDISVPRNIDPLVNNVDNAFVYDIDDLQSVVQANLKERTKEARKAEEIIAEEIGTFYRWVKSLDVVPTIIAIRNYLERIRKSEFEKCASQLEGLTDKDRETLDAMTRAIVKKILHSPINHLKKEADKVKGDLYIEAVRGLFDLPPVDEEVKKATSGEE
jgi:glutamyl-tRNA reductase